MIAIFVLLLRPVVVLVEGLGEVGEGVGGGVMAVEVGV